MRDYEVCLPEHDEWCVPACLQTILRSRRIEISQTEISVNFPDHLERGIFRGFEFNEELFQKFLRRKGFKLKCKFLNPFIHLDLYQNVDIFLNRFKEAQLHGDSQDLLVAYDSRFHQVETRRERLNHLAVFLDSSFESDEVRVTGFGREPYKDISLPLLVQNMHPDMNRNYGFYVIEDEQ